MKIICGISFPEARKIIGMICNTPTLVASYSAVIAEAEALPSATLACQTEMTMPIGASESSLIQE